MSVWPFSFTSLARLFSPFLLSTVSCCCRRRCCPDLPRRGRRCRYIPRPPIRSPCCSQCIPVGALHCYFFQTARRTCLFPGGSGTHTLFRALFMSYGCKVLIIKQWHTNRLFLNTKRKKPLKKEENRTSVNRKLLRVFSVSQYGICIPHCEIYIPHCGFCIPQCETENLSWSFEKRIRGFKGWFDAACHKFSYLCGVVRI